VLRIVGHGQTAGLASPAGMDLGFHYHRAAEFSGDNRRLLRSGGHPAPRDRQTRRAKPAFTLML
jgi:hypothetical protein